MNCTRCKRVIYSGVMCDDCVQIQSHARKHLHLTFRELNLKEKFQFVNSVMGGATPKGQWFLKIDTNKCMLNGEVFEVHPDRKVER